MTSSFLEPTPLLDFTAPRLAALVDARGWLTAPRAERIGLVYDFVREEVPFGYNRADDIPASVVLADGYGQCNTKTTLLMALLRGVGVPCRFHGATIHKRLQRGVVPEPFYRLAPDAILHSWAEVQHDGRWVALEGVILDSRYLGGLRHDVHPQGGAFLGYGVGTEDLGDPPVAWSGKDTAIQTTGITRDFGVYEAPDAFYAERGTNLAGPRALLYRNVVRHAMNRRVAALRAGCPRIAPRAVSQAAA